MKYFTKILRKFLSISIVKLLLLILISCDSFLDVEVPNSQLVGETIFEDEVTANAALIGLYANLRDNGILLGHQSGVSHSLGLYTDELVYWGDPSSLSFSFFENSILPSNQQILNYWNKAYNQIYTANTVIKGIQNSTHLETNLANSFKGEALFVRALVHFYLVNMFGEIPYIENTDYKENTTINKKSVDQIYTLIKNDLEESIDLLPDVYTSADRTRPNKYVALALLARLNLYMENWNNAELVTNQILDLSGLFQEQPTPENLFLKNSPETIWQLKPALEGGSTHEASTFTILSAPPYSSSLRETFVQLFEEEDLRRSFWIGEITDGSSTWFFPAKYKQIHYESTSSEYSIIFRLAEVYLIRAEARARMGNLTGAKNDLNKIRLRSGLLETTAETSEEILNAILKERQLELFTEFGHRFFDLKRLNKLDEQLQPIKPGWNSHEKLFPIPEAELGLNPNLLPQNSGY